MRMKSNLAIPFLSFVFILSACNKMEFKPEQDPSVLDIDFPVDPQPTITTTTSTTTTTVIVTTTTLPPTTTTTTTSTTTTTTLPSPVAVVTDFTVTSATTPSDILVIVDNSPAMFSPLRDSIPYRFDQFMDGLAGLNYHIAVTTGDAAGSKEYESGRLTRILRQAVPGAGIALTPERHFLDGSLGIREADYLLTTMMRPEAICVQVGTHLCPTTATGYQEPLKALSLFLDSPQGFLRSNSDVHVVIVSGRDEGAGSSAPEIIARPQQVVDQFNRLYSGRRLKIHTVARQPDARCFAGNDYQEANTLAQASQLTGGDRANICNEYERSSINAIAQKVKPSVYFQREFDLTCDPIDMNGDGSPDVRIVDVRTSANLPFTRSGRHITVQGPVNDQQDIRALYHCAP